MIKSVYTKWEEMSNNIPEQNKMNISEYFLSKNSNNKMYFGMDYTKNKKVYIEFDKGTLNNYECPEIVGMKIVITSAPYIDPSKIYLTVLSEGNMDEVFFAFTSTLADNITDSMSNMSTIEKFENTLKFYKDYFSNLNNSLSNMEEQGLCGELLYLEELIRKDGEKSVLYWLGPNKNKRDFVFENRACEVKSTLNQIETTITVSNENQLDPGNLEELKLVVYTLEKDPNGNVDVVTCVKKILNLLNDIQYNKVFISKIIQIGINFHTYKVKNKYTIQSKKIYHVNEEFPSLKKSNIPNVIYDVKYKINLNSLNEFLLKE